MIYLLLWLLIGSLLLNYIWILTHKRYRRENKKVAIENTSYIKTLILALALGPVVYVFYRWLYPESFK